MTAKKEWMIPVPITLRESTVHKLDKRRKAIPRSRYIRLLVEKDVGAQQSRRED